MKVLIFFTFLQFPLVDSCYVRPKGTCEDGWAYYERKTTGWCMKVFVERLMAKTTAESYCDENGAVLSSIDDLAMQNVILSLISAQNAKLTWLGAKLKSECRCGEDVCADPNNECGPKGYYWTDGYTTSNDYIKNNLNVTSSITDGQIIWLTKEGLIISYSGELDISAILNASMDSVICGKPASN
ncbi:unnamed protein product [Caenorhabditis angaria]|uniref:C-type lectin domain-containing protein n=1 Tax=Caenorhabditis angaria TaxID=860376 RepID=A0A9P1I8H4_9PELO|nr:unnamed protein product [Caenorhabditis angaria]